MVILVLMMVALKQENTGESVPEHPTDIAVVNTSEGTDHTSLTLILTVNGETKTLSGALVPPNELSALLALEYRRVALLVSPKVSYERVSNWKKHYIRDDSIPLVTGMLPNYLSIFNEINE